LLICLRVGLGLRDGMIEILDSQGRASGGHCDGVSQGIHAGSVAQRLARFCEGGTGVELGQVRQLK
jgi:hypothetical protein